MIVNFISKKVSPNFKIFFVNKDKKNLKYHNISSNSEVKKNILNSLSKKILKVLWVKFVILKQLTINMQKTLYYLLE